MYLEIEGFKLNKMFFLEIFNLLYSVLTLNLLAYACNELIWCCCFLIDYNFLID